MFSTLSFWLTYHLASDSADGSNVSATVFKPVNDKLDVASQLSYSRTKASFGVRLDQ